METNPGTAYAPRPTEPGPFGVQGQQPGTGLRPREDEVARRASQLPSNRFLWTALGTVGASLLLRAAGRRNASRFLGPLLLFGVYKLASRGGTVR